MIGRRGDDRNAKRVMWGRRIGRVLLASQFIYGGYGAASDPGNRTASLEKAGLPGGAGLVRFNGVAMLIGGVALALGTKPRAASVGLAIALVPTTVVGHAFWREADPHARHLQTIQFLKNASMLGGLFVEATSREGWQHDDHVVLRREPSCSSR